ncbi:3-phosphoshikimate 1-carboxyvinyltransferase [uncultured Imperialibacter sp.]|uniref:3-phosphoshikimate 1-carboxyvinyltransferase n=1 Tax=uncultured Imperialibacter sp. TaxID=1672639 RepID=UPI0030DBDD91|tara:strand:+ start:55935 stop:57164 length:1230 start_codon:yes stop_codon:yes gene_type:complete
MNKISINTSAAIPAASTINLSASKSESNRALIIQALSDEKINLNNLSDARDTQTMMRLLASKDKTWDVLDAGTTMRFLTAYLALTGKDQTITGSERMQQRPIKLLVDALRELGASIDYLKNDGYPPLKVSKITQQKTDSLKIQGNISSQYISALLMIAPMLPNGLTIELVGDVFSRPYIEMTLGLMQQFGVKNEWKENTIAIAPQKYTANSYTIESDWSGASYWLSMVSLSKSSKVKLTGLRENSYQGDIRIREIMHGLGLTTRFSGEEFLIEKKNSVSPMVIDFKTCPDLAQTVMVVATGLKSPISMTGLESLRIKETDRLAAMQTELAKFGATLVEETPGFWELEPPTELPEGPVTISTYEDHRMAMAFAPLAQKVPLIIEEPEVVNKSYPGFWEDCKKYGLDIKEA